MKKILITTGGTGGHVMPALNIFDHLNKKFDVKIVTDIRGKKFINKNKYSFDTIKINQISKNIFKLPFSLALMFISIIKGYLYLKKNKIKLVISTGGYMSLPFCLSAKFLNISIILFEPNMVLGRSNKHFLKFANKIQLVEHFFLIFIRACGIIIGSLIRTKTWWSPSARSAWITYDVRALSQAIREN